MQNFLKVKSRFLFINNLKIIKNLKKKNFLFFYIFFYLSILDFLFKFNNFLFRFLILNLLKVLNLCNLKFLSKILQLIKYI